MSTSSDPPMLVRTYRGKSLAEAAARMAREAPGRGSAGYVVTSQSWAPGGRSPAAWLFIVVGVAALLVGLFVYWPALIMAFVALLIGLVSRVREGELTVTWTKTR